MSFGSQPKRGRVGRWLRRGGVAWTAAAVAFAAAIALGTVGVSERGQLSHTKAALVTQVSISRDLQRQVKAVTDKNGQLDQQVSALNDRNSSVSSALDTCTQAVGVDEQFRQAVNDMMTAKTKGAFDTALARADQLYVKASALQDECLTQAGAGGSTL